MLASCVDDVNIFGGGKEGANLTFTATMNEQDWYGTRSAVNRDEIIPTDFVTDKGKRVSITSHEVNGISGERVRLDDQRSTRAIMTQAIDTRKLSISQVGFTQGNNKNTYVELLNMEATTTNGEEWSCNEFFVNRQDFTALRVFGALFPYSENYVIKTRKDNGEANNDVGSYEWLDLFRADYELASDSAQLQEDLLYAKQIRKFTGESYATSSPTPLEFRHAMTAVKVKLGSTGFVPAVIKQVRLRNVYKKGTLHFFDKYNGGQDENDMVNTSGWWEVDESETTTCVAVTDFDTQGEYNCYVTGDAATFMMIPQKLSQNATLELDIIFNGDPEEEVITIKAPIGGTEERPKYWNIGTTHEYIIDTKENVDGYYMVMEGIDNNERAKYVDAAGGEASISLKSYKTSENDEAGYKPLKWQYFGWSYDGEDIHDEDASWLHMSLADGTPVTIGTEGVGSITGERININIDAMPAENDVEHSAILRSREAKGGVSSGPYDLSRHEYGTGKSIGTTTANCYVIDAPGHYTFPTVYGNSMKDGAANPQAYGLDKSYNLNAGSPKGTSFVDYLDRQIISPLIQYNTKLRRAALIWEDVKGLVTDVKLTQRGDYVDFRVDRDNIDQGNAVIAVYDEKDQIVWSWHIWVTDENVKATVATGAGSYKAMPVNLGWKSTSKANAVRGRDIYLHFAQGESSDEYVSYQTTIRITQRSEYKSDRSSNQEGSSPYYQWGRKDPMVGAVGGHSIGVYTYDGTPFYCESLTTWGSPEILDNIKKGIIFAGTLAIGIATGGAGWLAVAGGAVAVGGGAGADILITRMEEKYCTTTQTWGTTIGYAIQHPTCDIKSAMTWTDCKNHDPYHDLWGIGQNTDNRSKKVVKTIYDPCPAGFHVPEGDAFDGMHKGYNATSKGLDNGTMYLPSCGARIDYVHLGDMKGDFDLVLLQNGTGCGYWTAAPSKEISGSDNHDHESFRKSEGAYALVADQDNAGVTKDSYEAWGYCMRPVADY